MFKSQLEPSSENFHETQIFVENIFDTVKKAREAKAARSLAESKLASYDYSFDFSPSKRKKTRKNAKNKKSPKGSGVKTTTATIVTTPKKKPRKNAKAGSSEKKKKPPASPNKTPRKYTKRAKVTPSNDIDDEEAAFILSSISQRSFDSFYNRFNGNSIQIPLESPPPPPQTTTTTTAVKASPTPISTQSLAYHVLLDHNYWIASEPVMPKVEEPVNLLVTPVVAPPKAPLEVNNNKLPPLDVNCDNAVKKRWLRQATSENTSPVLAVTPPETSPDLKAPLKKRRMAHEYWTEQKDEIIVKTESVSEQKVEEQVRSSIIVDGRSLVNGVKVEQTSILAQTLSPMPYDPKSSFFGLIPSTYTPTINFDAKLLNFGEKEEVPESTEKPMLLTAMKKTKTSPKKKEKKPPKQPKVKKMPKVKVKKTPKIKQPKISKAQQKKLNKINLSPQKSHGDNEFAIGAEKSNVMLKLNGTSVNGGGKLSELLMMGRQDVVKKECDGIYGAEKNHLLPQNSLENNQKDVLAITVDQKFKLEPKNVNNITNEEISSTLSQQVLKIGEKKCERFEMDGKIFEIAKNSQNLVKIHQKPLEIEEIKEILAESSTTLLGSRINEQKKINEENSCDAKEEKFNVIDQSLSKIGENFFRKDEKYENLLKDAEKLFRNAENCSKKAENSVKIPEKSLSSPGSSSNAVKHLEISGSSFKSAEDNMKSSQSYLITNNSLNYAENSANPEKFIINSQNHEKIDENITNSIKSEIKTEETREKFMKIEDSDTESADCEEFNNKFNKSEDSNSKNNELSIQFNNSEEFYPKFFKNYEKSEETDEKCFKDEKIDEKSIKTIESFEESNEKCLKTEENTKICLENDEKLLKSEENHEREMKIEEKSVKLIENIDKSLKSSEELSSSAQNTSQIKIEENSDSDESSSDFKPSNLKRKFDEISTDQPQPITNDDEYSLDSIKSFDSIELAPKPTNNPVISQVASILEKVIPKTLITEDPEPKIDEDDEDDSQVRESVEEFHKDTLERLMLANKRFCTNSIITNPFKSDDGFRFNALKTSLSFETPSQFHQQPPPYQRSISEVYSDPRKDRWSGYENRRDSYGSFHYDKIHHREPITTTYSMYRAQKASQLDQRWNGNGTWSQSELPVQEPQRVVEPPRPTPVSPIEVPITVTPTTPVCDPFGGFLKEKLTAGTAILPKTKTASSDPRLNPSLAVDAKKDESTPKKKLSLEQYRKRQSLTSITPESSSPPSSISTTPTSSTLPPSFDPSIAAAAATG